MPCGLKIETDSFLKFNLEQSIKPLLLDYSIHNSIVPSLLPLNKMFGSQDFKTMIISECSLLWKEFSPQKSKLPSSQPVTTRHDLGRNVMHILIDLVAEIGFPKFWPTEMLCCCYRLVEVQDMIP